MRVESFSHPTEFADISFAVRRGEILGVYGLVGSGRSEVMQAVFGLNRAASGRVFVDGAPVAIRRPADAVRAGIVYVPEDRQGQGAVLKISHRREHRAADVLRSVSRCRLHRRGRERALAQRYADELQVRMAGLDQPVEDPFRRQSAEGRHREMARDAAEGARSSTSRRKASTSARRRRSTASCPNLVRQGLAVVMVSSELPEVLGMADRILVMARGRLRATFPRAGANPESILRAATDA